MGKENKNEKKTIPINKMLRISPRPRSGSGLSWWTAETSHDNFFSFNYYFLFDFFFVLEEEECEKHYDVTMWVFAVQKNSKSIENRASEFFVQETHYDKYKMNRCG